MLENSHEFLAMSFAPVWGHCSGAPQMAAMYPQNEETEDAREGTATHWIAEQALAADRAGKPWPYDFYK